MVCPCCNPAGWCCCTGESPLNYNANYRRITSVSGPGDCDGTAIASKEAASPCDGATLIVSWCGLSVELTVGEYDKSVVVNPGLTVAGCGTSYDNVLYYRSLEVFIVSGSGIYAYQGWGSECGRCVVRFVVSLQESTTECGTRTRQYFIDWRQDCDRSVHIEFYNGDSSLWACTEPAPTASVTFAP